MIKYKQLTFHDTEQRKAYDGNDLIGNIGGYIGMFLGYALINLSDSLIAVFEATKKRLLQIGKGRKEECNGMET